MIILEMLWNIMAVVGIVTTSTLLYVLWENLK